MTKGLDTGVKKFEELSDPHRRKYILAIVLSVFEPGTFIHSRGRRTNLLDNDLEDQLSRVLYESRDIPLIGINFSFDERMTKPYCEEVKGQEFSWALSPYGRHIGLENFGPDFDYRITGRTGKIAEEGRKYLTKEQVKFLKGLGRKIRVR